MFKIEYPISSTSKMTNLCAEIKVAKTLDDETKDELENYENLTRFSNVRLTLGEKSLYFHALALMDASSVFRDILSGKTDKFGETADIPIDTRYSADALNIVLNIIRKGMDVVDDVDKSLHGEICAIMRQYDVNGWEDILYKIIDRPAFSMEEISKMRSMGLNIVSAEFAERWACGYIKITGEVSQDICILARNTNPLDFIHKPWCLYENLDAKSADEKYIDSIAKIILKAWSMELTNSDLILKRFYDAKSTGIIPAIWDAVVAKQGEITRESLSQRVLYLAGYDQPPGYKPPRFNQPLSSIMWYEKVRRDTYNSTGMHVATLSTHTQQ